MKVEVHPLYVQGRPLRANVRAGRPPYAGVLRIQESRVHTFGRMSVCAHLFSANDTAPIEQLPGLQDVQIIWAKDGAMRLRGVETVNGVLYAQAWEVRPC